MSKIRRERTKKKKENGAVPIWEQDLLDTCKAASATDCTGLIQISPIDENEIEAYKDVYDFGPSPDDYVD
ncbi:hypothetical protein [Qingrenia yutianensis]|uniref:Uncharacterized protein n=1 Tax=Qingrenia yutianensis TaxID=2763676 RepID=A0A926ILT3_9FIRM|nr:hypothetical protein [Qingrenia yutianensis]MBC8595332.1 hypothetical protein [Qingrenia yutianensis]